MCDTEINAPLMQNPELRQQFLEMIPVGRFGQPHVMRGDREPHLVFFPSLGEALHTVGPDRLQHPVPRLTAVVDGEERLLHQAEDRGQDSLRGQRAVLAHLFRSRERGPGRESGEPPGENLLRPWKKASISSRFFSAGEGGTYFVER